MGIPCAHTILDQTRGHPITTKDFDDHWLLNPEETQAEANAVPLILKIIDDLFGGITSLSKAKQPFAFDHIQTKM
ncbi:hypothetical protein BG006_004536, partial [Podila minutissima]